MSWCNDAQSTRSADSSRTHMSLPPGVAGHSGTYVPPAPAPGTVKPGDPSTLGYGTDQGRWLAQSIAKPAGAAPNPFRCAFYSTLSYMCTFPACLTHNAQPQCSSHAHHHLLVLLRAVRAEPSHRGKHQSQRQRRPRLLWLRRCHHRTRPPRRTSTWRLLTPRLLPEVGLSRQRQRITRPRQLRCRRALCRL